MFRALFRIAWSSQPGHCPCMPGPAAAYAVGTQNVQAMKGNEGFLNSNIIIEAYSADLLYDTNFNAYFYMVEQTIQLM